MALGAPLQSTSNLTFANNTYMLTFASPPAPGHGVIVWFRNKLTTVATMQAGGGALTRVIPSFVNADCEYWYLPAWVAGSTITFTVTGPSNTLRAAAYEWPCGLTLSGTPLASSGVTATPTTASLSVSTVPALVLASSAILNGPTRVGGPTNGFLDLPVPTQQDGNVAYQIVSSTGNASTTQPFATANGWDVIIAAFTETAAPPPPPTDVTIPLKKWADQVYSAQKNLKFDAYYSLTVGGALSTRPQIVFIHGGGWNTGDKSGWPAEMEALAALGFIVYTINYTLCNGVTVFPVNVQDVKTCFGYLAANGLGDPNKISLWGYSAGGHLALMVGLSSKAQWASAEWPSQNYTIKSIAAIAPPSDLNTMYPETQAMGQQAISDLLGYVPSTNPTTAAAASPVSYATSAAPPTLLLCGDADLLVPTDQTQAMAMALTTAGATVTRLVFAGLDHNMDASNPAGGPFSAIVAFLEMWGR